MNRQKLYLIVAALLFATILPIGALAQSQTSNDEAQQLRKLEKQMQAQMSKMQAEIDQLQGTKPETPPSQQPAAPAAPPAQQEHIPNYNRRSKAPPRARRSGDCQPTGVCRGQSSSGTVKSSARREVQWIFSIARNANHSEDRRLLQDRFHSRFETGWKY